MTQTTRHQRRLAALNAAITEQRQWIESHGSTLSGYCERYGSVHAPDFTRWPNGYYGAGGEAIYAADLNEYHRLLAQRSRSPEP